MLKKKEAKNQFCLLLLYLNRKHFIDMKKVFLFSGDFRNWYRQQWHGAVR